MRFNSVRSSDYSQSARAVSKASDQIFDAAISGKPDFTKISKEAIKGRSLERRTATEAEGRVAQAGIKAAADVRRTRMKADTADKVSDIKRPAKRMAGIVGGLGALAGGYVMMEGNKKDKAERDELRKYRTELDEKAEARDAASALRQQELIDLLTKQADGGGGSSDPKPSTPVSQQSEASAISLTSVKPQSGKSNWGALSSIIRTVEGTTGSKGYRTRFGGHQFDDLSKHPNIKAPTPWGTSSEAAGAYQFMMPTWKEAKSALGLTDFSPESQEKAGRFLTERRGVNPDTRFNTFEEFSAGISKLSPEWAGLPNSQKGRTGYYGQANADMNQLWTQYQNYFN